MATILALLQAFAAVPKVAGIISKVIAAYMAWLDNKEMERIQLAAHDLRKAKTQDEKRAALQKWFNSTK